MGGLLVMAGHQGLAALRAPSHSDAPQYAQFLWKTLLKSDRERHKRHSIAHHLAVCTIVVRPSHARAGIRTRDNRRLYFRKS